MDCLKDKVKGCLLGGAIGDALAISLFCVARHIDDFRKAIVSAVNHGGDSDSTGAVAGNIIGSILGMKGIPEEYLSELQLTSLMSDMAERALE
ncbi:MAG: ADP-ribosylglycohydrolase family protein [Muribaculaceae bacterium]|nr:ADP-ribosylglycohydrolase family protein [Muribaculaceae bacterium]